MEVNEPPFERCPIDLLLWPSALEAGLRFFEHLLDCLNSVSAGQRSPPSHTPALDDDVSVDEDWSEVSRHPTSKRVGGGDAVSTKQFVEVIYG